MLADQVGLGKTIQLAMAALLMALDDPDGGPILVLAPKPLLQQWQDELMELLLLPSARWNGRAWVDENELEYPSEGVEVPRQMPAPHWAGVAGPGGPRAVGGRESTSEPALHLRDRGRGAPGPPPQSAQEWTPEPMKSTRGPSPTS